MTEIKNVPYNRVVVRTDEDNELATVMINQAIANSAQGHQHHSDCRNGR